jgi:hypothetical protein
MSANIDHHAIAGQNAPAAAVQAYFDGLRRDEPAGAHDQLGPARPVTVEVHRDQPVDHLALARQHLRHVDGGGAGHRSEPIGVTDQLGDFSAPDLILAREAVGVGAGTADQLALDHHGSIACSRHMPGQEFAGLAAAENQEVNALGLGHHHLPIQNGALTGSQPSRRRSRMRPGAVSLPDADEPATSPLPDRVKWG